APLLLAWWNCWRLRCVSREDLANFCTRSSAISGSGERMQSKRTQIGTLIVPTSGIQLANAFFGTFISLRVALENFDTILAGFVLSSYFAGFAVGALRCNRIIERVGHIRAYAAFAGVVVVATSAIPLLIGPLSWLVLRGSSGSAALACLSRPRAG